MHPIQYQQGPEVAFKVIEPNMSIGELWNIRFILHGRFSENKWIWQGAEWAFMCETVVFLTSRAFKRSNSNFVFSFSSSVLLLSLLESSSAAVWFFSMPSLHFLLSSDSFSWNNFFKCHYSQEEMKLTIQLSSDLPSYKLKKDRGSYYLLYLLNGVTKGLLNMLLGQFNKNVYRNELLHLHYT